MLTAFRIVCLRSCFWPGAHGPAFHPEKMHTLPGVPSAWVPEDFASLPGGRGIEAFAFFLSQQQEEAENGVHASLPLHCQKNPAAKCSVGTGGFLRSKVDLRSKTDSILPAAHLHPAPCCATMTVAREPVGRALCPGQPAPRIAFVGLVFC